MRLFDQDGNRLYLTAKERQDFLDVAKTKSPKIRTFCETLAYTGARISEVLAISPKSVDLDGFKITVRSLKKRDKIIFRTIPVPTLFIDTLNTAHGIREAQMRSKTSSEPIWSWTRQHASDAIIKGVMKEAGIPEGAHRTAKGLRHSYGVNAITNDVPLNMLQKWMGHADIKTTAIYANAIGQEEQDIAARMWA